MWWLCPFLCALLGWCVLESTKLNPRSLTWPALTPFYLLNKALWLFLLDDGCVCNDAFIHPSRQLNMIPFPHEQPYMDLTWWHGWLLKLHDHQARILYWGRVKCLPLNSWRACCWRSAHSTWDTCRYIWGNLVLNLTCKDIFTKSPFFKHSDECTCICQCVFRGWLFYLIRETTRLFIFHISKVIEWH